MADENTGLLVTIEARTAAFEKALARIEKKSAQTFGAVKKSADTNMAALEKTIGRASAFETKLAAVGRGFTDLSRTIAPSIAAITAALSAREIARLIDTGTRISNSLKVAGLSGEELESVYGKLLQAAQRNAVPVEVLAGLYGKAAQAQKELGVTSDDLIKFSDNVALSLRVAGTDATAASGALLQLGQALGSGKVQAEEFNSVLEGAPTIAQAVARGLKEAGGSVSQLKALVVDGKISSEAFFRAFQAGAVSLENAAGTSTLTTEQALTKVSNALVDIARDFDQATGTSQKFADSMGSVANALENIDVGGFIARIREAKAALVDFLNAAGNSSAFDSLNQLLGTVDASGKIINPDVSEAETKIAGLEREIQLLQQRIELNSELGMDNTEALARLGEVQAALNQIRASAANLPATVEGLAVTGDGIVPVTGGTNGQMGGSTSRGGARRREVHPVSLSDFAPPVSRSSGGRRSGGGGGKTNPYASQIEQIKEATLALQLENQALSLVSATTGDFETAQARARAEADLLAAAMKAGVAVTPELRENVTQLASAYASAEAESRRLADAQQASAQAVEEFKNSAADITSGFVSDLRNGKSAADALSNALDKVIDKLLEASINSAFGVGKSSSTGIFGGLFTSLLGFDGGGYTGSGGKLEPAGIVHRDEFVFTKKATQRAGVDALYRLMDYLETGNMTSLMGAGIPGFADGGYVGASNIPAIPSASAMMTSTVGSGGDMPASNDNGKFVYAPVINAQGADQAALARVQRQLDEQARNFNKMVDARNSTSRLRGTRG